MQLPCELLKCDESKTRKWQDHLKTYGAEGLWRRTQSAENKIQSGWRTEKDARRKVLHYFYDMDIERESFLLKNIFLWVCYTFPQREIERYELRIKRIIQEFGWREICYGKYHKGSLEICLAEVGISPKDEQAGRQFPADYRTLEIAITSEGYEGYKKAQENPWDVLASGFRKKEVEGREVNRIHSIEELTPFLPAQIELGCGPSIEAGIAPLKDLHAIYFISEPWPPYKFILDLNQDRLVDNIISEPKTFFTQATQIYKRILVARITKFYKVLRILHAKGIFVGPIITNNFDGLSSVVGLKTDYIRKYSDKDIVPKIEFDQRAKSLLAIGSHADRRHVQKQARQAGLVVVHIDPEGFYEENGLFVPYPLESPQNGDFVWNSTAGICALAFAKYFNLGKIEYA